MSIPAKITSELASITAQVTAASPLAAAPRTTVKAIQLNTVVLVDDIDAAIGMPSLLDTWIPPADPIGMIAGFNTIAVDGTDQATLALMRGVTGRALSNLDQVA